MCFDASASPIRNIQRIGRTGRHRAGRVLYILAQGKEMDNYHRNKEVCLLLEPHADSALWGLGAGWAGRSQRRSRQELLRCLSMYRIAEMPDLLAASFRSGMS